MKLCDAHFHFDMKKNDPVCDMVQIMDQYDIKAAVLILNSNAESALFQSQEKRLSACAADIHPAILLDIRHLDDFGQNTRWLMERQAPFSIKLHPRISNIQKKDFQAVADVLSGISYHNIIIDAFYYGPRPENLIYNELALSLAETFPSKKIVLAHFGGAKVLETMLLTRAVPNIYYDLSCTVSYFHNTSVWMDLCHCVSKNVGRVMYGSDYPAFTEADALESVRRLLCQFAGHDSGDVCRKLMAQNAYQVYFQKEADVYG